jgi:hypothetical protein
MPELQRGRHLLCPVKRLGGEDVAEVADRAGGDRRELPALRNQVVLDVVMRFVDRACAPAPSRDLSWNLPRAILLRKMSIPASLRWSGRGVEIHRCRQSLSPGEAEGVLRGRRGEKGATVEVLDMWFGPRRRDLASQLADLTVTMHALIALWVALLLAYYRLNPAFSRTIQPLHSTACIARLQGCITNLMSIRLHVRAFFFCKRWRSNIFGPSPAGQRRFCRCVEVRH